MASRRGIIGTNLQGAREIAVAVVPEDMADREAVVARVEQAGGMAVTLSEMEAMQRRKDRDGLDASFAEPNGESRLSADERQRRAEQRETNRQAKVTSRPDSDDRIAKANAKRERKAASRLRALAAATEGQ